VVKNVAGYDLVRLVVGSRGTLGLITRLHVRLRSLPPSDVTILAELDDAAAAASLMIPLRDAVGPVALELITPATRDARWRIALRLHGSPDVTAAARTAALRLLPSGRVLEAGGAAAAWAALAAAEAAAPIRVRCAALPTALPALAEAAARFLKSASDNDLHDWRGSAHATEAVLRLWGPEPDQARAGALAQFLAELRKTAVSTGGTCVCDRGPESVSALLAAPAPSPRLVQLERALRLRFDPAAILVGS
jgi:glycolate oxidase FAD binding subunit